MNVKCDNIAVSVRSSEYQCATLLPTDNEDRSGSLQRSGLAESKQIGQELLSASKLIHINIAVPVPVAARSKASVCDRSAAEIVGSNPTGDMGVCLLCVLCVVR